MEKALGKILARLEVMPFDITDVSSEGNRVTVVVEGVPDRRVKLIAETESWEVRIIGSGGVMRIMVKAEPEVIERDLDDIAMVIVTAVLLTIPRFMASLLQRACAG